MFTVIFEVEPRPERRDEYLELAKLLKPEIEKIDGFIDNERFASQRTPGRLLSLSTWRDEKAVIRWRTLGMHHMVQEKGRFAVFEDYHLRVGEVVADNAVPPGQTLRQQRLDETEIGAAKSLTITEFSPGDVAVGLDVPTSGLVDKEIYESIYTAGKFLVLASWRDANAAASWSPHRTAPEARHRHVRVVRDYGMSDRREAPQYYPDVAPG